ncbi:MAG TPA: hypothetical protein VME23_15970 [Terracidiphilus sp.]|nr:hypothetical protein [Terracidiphilus sp.]
MKQVARPLAGVVLMQTFPYPMGFYANDRVLLWVEVWSPAQGLDCDFVFGHMVDSSKKFVANVLEESAGIGVAGK